MKKINIIMLLTIPLFINSMQDVGNSPLFHTRQKLLTAGQQKVEKKRVKRSQEIYAEPKQRRKDFCCCLGVYIGICALFEVTSYVGSYSCSYALNRSYDAITSYFNSTQY